MVPFAPAALIDGKTSATLVMNIGLKFKFLDILDGGIERLMGDLKAAFGMPRMRTIPDGFTGYNRGDMEHYISMGFTPLGNFSVEFLHGATIRALPRYPGPLFDP